MNNRRKKVTEEQIFKLLDLGWKQIDIAREFGVSRQYISIRVIRSKNKDYKYKKKPKKQLTFVEMFYNDTGILVKVV